MLTREAIGIDAVEPYSKIVKAGGFIFVKSHVGYNPETDEYPDNIADQTRFTLDHLEHALEKAGATLAAVVKVNVYLSDIDADFDGMHSAYLDYFGKRGIVEQPARTTVGVPLSWPQLKVQMDLLAVE